jgi:hypothetical protein
MKKHYAKEVKTGKWVYDNEVTLIVKIFRLNYDYYYEIAKADDRLESNEEPNLNKNGESYMIKWGEGEFSDKDLVTRDWGGLTLESAIKKAESKIKTDIKWDD